MKKTFALFSTIILVGLLVVTSFFSCKRTKEAIPLSEFAPYISAYTGGLIYSSSSIQIELTESPDGAVPNTEIKEKLFSFSPSLKGKAYWASSNTIEFVPEEGSLKNGQVYTAKFKLGKVMDVEKRHKVFEFNFRVEDKNFDIQVFPLEITDSKTVSVLGQITLSDNVDMESLKKALSFTLSNKKTLTPAIETVDNRIFLFRVDNIERAVEDLTLEISLNGKPLGTERKAVEKVTIPALDVFKVLSVETIYEPQFGVQIVFSDPLSTSQNLKGLITIPEVKSFTTQVQDNKVNIFFERSNLVKITVTVHKNIKNINNEELKASDTRELIIKQLKPQVELINSGNILPNSSNLIFSFRAVSLRAVDVKITQIYESNVLSFLQINQLSGSRELKRVGRLMFKKTIRLDSNPSNNLNLWQNYSIDLTDIIKKQPGAIYRVELSFRKEHSAYECDDNRAIGTTKAEQETSMMRITSDEITADEENEWDTPSSYSYYDEYDDYYDYYYWDDYDWDERDNPCHATYYMNSDRKVSSNVMMSNLGVIAKANSENKLWVSVANIVDTKPAANINVTIYNYQLQVIGSGKTDSEGFTAIDVKGKPFVLVAEGNGNKTYMRLVDGENNSLSRFDTGGKRIEKGIKGYIYGERGVWRPGDTLHITFVLFDLEKRIPNNHPVSIEIYNPQGQFYTKQTAAKGVNGFYTFTIPTSQDDPTGLWNAYIKLGGTSFHKALRIETIKPNRLKINLDLGTEKIEAFKERVPATLTSSWLTGAIARNLEARVELTLSRAGTQFKGYEKYRFNSPASDFNTYESEVFAGKLDESGVAKFDLKLPSAENAPGMLNASFVTRVFEPGGDASIFAQTMPFSPFKSYVGLNLNQPEGKYIETDVVHTFDVVNLNTEGKIINNTNVEYRIYKVGWSWWWQRDSESFSNYVNSSSYKPVASGKVKMTNGKGTFNFVLKYPDWGRFLVYVVDKNSGHSTGGVVYIDWPEYRGRSNKSDPSGVKMLAFSTDKTSYEIGETVTVIIPASAGGTALVALENGSSVLDRKWVQVAEKGDTKYTFKVTKDMSPNFFIHISLLQPHAQTINDLPIRMYGVMPVMVTNKESHLEPQIDMPDVLRPETEFTVKVKEKSGKPMTYTLAIVDDGLLDLTNFKTPNAWSEFYAREALGIRTWDMYDNIIGAFAGKYGGMFSIGGDEEVKSGNTKANRFRPVVKFIGPFSLGKGKSNTHKITLPMYVGSVRTMIVAGQDGAYGNAEKSTPVRSPLMILSSLPRVLSSNEEISLPINIFAMEDGVKKVTVKVETQNGLLVLDENAQKTVNFSKPGDELVYFKMKTKLKTGIEKVTITASGNGHSTKETIEIDVRNPNPAIIVSDSKLLQGGETGEFNYKLSANNDENWVRLETSRIPSVDISRRFDFLYNYDHYCTEQVTSRAFPMLYISKFKDVTDEESKMLKANIQQGIQNLYSRQRPTGGFLYWPSYTSTNDWITSYVGHFFIAAKEKGYEVNDGVLTKWKSYQREKARSWSADSYSKYTRRNSELMQAYRLYTLALAGTAESGAMNRMKETKDLSVQARWTLAAAYAIDGKIKVAEELVFNIPSTVESYYSDYTYGSSMRDEAMILETMILINRMEDAFKQAQRVSKNLSQENYFSTQTTAYSLVAMGLLAEKTSGTIDFGWSVNGAKQKDVKSPKAIIQTDLDRKVLDGKVSLKNNEKGMLYVNLVSKTKPAVDTLPAVANNLKLEVSYMDMNGSSINISDLKQGTDFVASVRVTNISLTENYTDIALTHIIPSGWEIFNDRMFEAGGNGVMNSSSYSYRDIRDDRVLTYFNLNKGSSVVYKVRLQATYIGSFVLPAVQCEAMYDTGAQARTKAGKVSVVK